MSENDKKIEQKINQDMDKKVEHVSTWVAVHAYIKEKNRNRAKERKKLAIWFSASAALVAAAVYVISLVFPLNGGQNVAITSLSEALNAVRAASEKIVMQPSYHFETRLNSTLNNVLSIKSSSAGAVKINDRDIDYGEQIAQTEVDIINKDKTLTQNIDKVYSGGYAFFSSGELGIKYQSASESFGLPPETAFSASLFESYKAYFQGGKTIVVFTVKEEAVMQMLLLAAELSGESLADYEEIISSGFIDYDKAVITMTINSNNILVRLDMALSFSVRMELLQINDSFTLAFSMDYSDFGAEITRRQINDSLYVEIPDYATFSQRYGLAYDGTQALSNYVSTQSGTIQSNIFSYETKKYGNVERVAATFNDKVTLYYFMGDFVYYTDALTGIKLKKPRGEIRLTKGQFIDLSSDFNYYMFSAYSPTENGFSATLKYSGSYLSEDFDGTVEIETQEDIITLFKYDNSDVDKHYTIRTSADDTPFESLPDFSSYSEEADFNAMGLEEKINIYNNAASYVLDGEYKIVSSGELTGRSIYISAQAGGKIVKYAEVGYVDGWDKKIARYFYSDGIAYYNTGNGWVNYGEVSLNYFNHVICSEKGNDFASGFLPVVADAEIMEKLRSISYYENDTGNAFLLEFYEPSLPYTASSSIEVLLSGERLAYTQVTYGDFSREIPEIT